MTDDGVADADFRVLAENIPTLCWIANGDGYIVWYHRRWHDYCGSTPAEMEGWGWQSFHDPVRLPEVMARWTVAITAGDPFEMIFPLRGADGTFRPFLTRTQPVRDPDGTVVRWFGVNTEIADRVAAEAALRAGEARFGAIVDSIDQMVWSTGADGMPDFFNQRWREFTGASVGALTQGIIHPDDLARVIAAWTHSVASGEPFRLEYRMQHQDMRYRWVFGRAQCVRDEDGAIVRWYGTCTDIDEIVAARDVLTRSRSELEALVTERTAALNLSQEALAQAQKMAAIGQLTGGIVHDFNNMLSIVIGNLDLARRRVVDEPRVLRLLDNAVEGARRAAELTARLLAFSRQTPLQPTVIEVNRLAARMSELLQRTLGEEVRIETVSAGGLWRTRADAAQLENAIVNLCVNARDAMPGGRRLTIETGNAALDDAYAREHPGVPAGQYVQISVGDTGTGMPPKIVARAFEPFYTTKEVGKGTSLGLSQVYGFIKQSGGHVKIYSEIDVGNAIKIYLPRSHDGIAADPAVVAEGIRRTLAGEVIRLVEDDPRVPATNVDALRELGYGVIEAVDGEAALVIIARHTEVRMLFTDVVMPGMNGRVLADLARALRPELPVLFTSGYTRNAIIHDGTLEAGLAFLAKPFTVEQLAAKVRAVLDTGA